MNAYLFEGHWVIYFILGVLLIVALFAYWQTRHRSTLIASGVLLGILGLYFVLDFCVETEHEADRNQIRERVHLMARSVSQRDPDQLFQHISQKFISPAGRSREALLGLARMQIGNGNVTGVTVWDLHFDEPPSRERNEGVIRFQFKISGNVGEGLAFPCAATYAREGANGWMLRKVVIYNPVMGLETVEAPF